MVNVNVVNEEYCEQKKDNNINFSPYFSAHDEQKKLHKGKNVIEKKNLFSEHIDDLHFHKFEFFVLFLFY